MRKGNKGSALARASSALSRAGQADQSLRKSVLDDSSGDDDLKQYLSGLSKKTSAKPALTGLSDISISSDDGTPTKAVQQKRITNKFLKSSKSTPGADPIAVKVAPVAHTPTLQVQSPALLKLSQHNEKYLRKNTSPPKKPAFFLTDESAISDISTSEPTTSPKRPVSFLKSASNKKVQKALPAPTTTVSSEDEVGKTGRKFLKKKTNDPVTTTPTKSGKGRSQATTTDDDSEDMAEFIQGLSPSASEISDNTPTQATSEQKSIEIEEGSSFATETFSAASSVKSESINTEPIGAVKLMDVTQLDVSISKTGRTKSKPVKQKSATSVFSTIGLMTVDDLMASQTISSSHGADNSIQTESVQSSIKSASSFHTSTNESIKHSNESIHTETVATSHTASEIPTESSTKQSSYSEHFSDDDTLRDTESIQSEQTSRTSRTSRTTSPSYRSRSSRSSRSYSTRSYSSYSRSRSHSYRSRSSRSSGSRSTTRSESRLSDRSSSDNSEEDTVEESYTAEFTQDESELAPTDSITAKDGTISLIEEQSIGKLPTENKSTEKQSAGKHREVKNAQVQTGLDLEDMILKYYWTKETVSARTVADMHEETTATGLEATQSKPTVTEKLAISEEALDAHTNYNPSMILLEEMLKTQLELSRNFLDMQKNIHSTIMGSIEREHKYTTLEDTKQYIKEHRKPRLTFEEAVQIVRQEMNYD